MLLVPCSQIINIPNSMTVLPELLPYSIEMVRFASLSAFSAQSEIGQTSLDAVLSLKPNAMLADLAFKLGASPPCVIAMFDAGKPWYNTLIRAIHEG